ncbi:MAG: threonine synthase [Verrucomicrobia bacterium]|nr:threonine synthase [Verrucomicrobiota bacterium]
MNPRTNRSIGVIDRYRSLLPVDESTPVITLGEGSTPLIESRKLSALLGNRCRVFLKFEGANPTGSFKDRGMTVAVSLAAQRGATTLICASTGNTSAAAAAYAARSGMRCAVLLPAGKIALGKIAQAFVYGAKVIAIDDNFDACLNVVRELQKEPTVAVVNSINPDRLEGQKTAAFEVVDELGDAPALHLLPVGNAGNITAYWKGYQEYRQLNRASRTPRMVGFQAAGAAPIFLDRVIPAPETAASAIRIGNPASWGPAKTALQESGGAIDIVSDDEIFAAQRWVAANEGVFAEPASAASVAGFMKCADPSRRCSSCPMAQLPDESSIVLTLTGHGLKDVASVLDQCPAPLKAEANKESVLSLLS